MKKILSAILLLIGTIVLMGCDNKKPPIDVDKEPTMRIIELNVVIPQELPTEAVLTIGSSMNDWTPSNRENVAKKIEGKKYQISLKVDIKDAEVIIQYKYTIQLKDMVAADQWKCVEKEDDGVTEIENREVKVSSKSPKTTIINDVVKKFADPNYVQPSTVVGNLDIIKDMAMPQFTDNRTRTIRVLTPQNYDASDSTKHYPVIYMHDAQNLFDTATSFAGEWEVDESLAALMRDKGFGGAIVVGIDNSSDRMSEYTPALSDTPNANGWKYGQFIVDTLKPYIDEHYNTNPSRETTAISGSSMGGLISFYLGLKHKDVFGMIGLFSASFQVNTKEARQEFINGLNKDGEMPRIYIDGGKKETLWTYVGPVSDELYEAGYPIDNIYTLINDNHGHNEAAWRARFPGAMQWLCSDTKGNYVAPTEILNFEVTISSGVVQYINDLGLDGDFYIYTGQISSSIKLIHAEGNLYTASMASKKGSTFEYQLIYYKNSSIQLLAINENGVVLEKTSILIEQTQQLTKFQLEHIQIKEKVTLNVNAPLKTDEYFESFGTTDGRLIAYTTSLANSFYLEPMGNNKYQIIFLANSDSEITFKLLYYSKNKGVELYENAADGRDVKATKYAIGNQGNTVINHNAHGWQVEVKLRVNVTSPVIEVPEGEILKMGLYQGPFGGSWRNSQMTSITPTTFTFEKTVFAGKISLTAGYILFKTDEVSPYKQAFEKNENGKAKVSDYEVYVPFLEYKAGEVLERTIVHTVVTF